MKTVAPLQSTAAPDAARGGRAQAAAITETLRNFGQIGLWVGLSSALILYNKVRLGA